MTGTATLPAKRVNGSINKALSGFQAILESRKDTIRAVLPKHMTPERVIKLASSAFSKTPLLQKCTPLSLYNSVIKASELGLDCSGTLGSAYLVPFKRNFKDPTGKWQSEYECQLIVGYRGLIDLARRSGQITSIEARVVYANDHFELSYGTDGKLSHIPALDEDPGSFRLVYGVAKLDGGGVQTEVMTQTQVNQIRDSSKAYDPRTPRGPWHDHYEEMARKTVIRRLCKYLPMSVELQSAIAAEEEVAVNDFEPEKLPQPALDLNDTLASEVQAEEESQTSENLPDDTYQPPSSDHSQTSPQTSVDEPDSGAITVDDLDDWDAAKKILRDKAKDAQITSKADFEGLLAKLLGIVPEKSTPEARYGLCRALIEGRVKREPWRIE